MHKVKINPEDFKDIISGCKSYIVVSPTKLIKVGENVDIKEDCKKGPRTLQVKISHIHHITSAKTIVSFNL